jgi:hypothetical protein
MKVANLLKKGNTIEGKFEIDAYWNQIKTKIIFEKDDPAKKVLM